MEPFNINDVIKNPNIQGYTTNEQSFKDFKKKIAKGFQLSEQEIKMYF